MKKFTRFLSVLILGTFASSGFSDVKPLQVQLRLDVIKVSKATYQEKANDPNLREILFELVRGGAAELKIIMESLGKSGQTVSVDSREDFQYPSRIEKGEVVFEATKLGDYLVSGFTIGADAYTIDINLTFSHQSTFGGEELKDDHGYVYTRPYFYNIQSNQSVTIFDGQSIRVFVQRDSDPNSVVVGFITAKLVDPTGKQ